MDPDPGQVAKKREAAISTLMARKFPMLARIGALRPDGQWGPGVHQRGVSPEQRTEVDRYRDRLEAMPLDELFEWAEREREAERREEAVRLEAIERSASYNQPDAEADVGLWSRKAFWEPEEAVALLLGKDPRVVSGAAVRRFGSSPFTVRYAELQDLIRRAGQSGQIVDTSPGAYLDWARRINLDIPSNLEAAVTANGGTIADWRKRVAELEAALSAVAEERDALHGRVQSLEARSPTEKSVSTRERASLLKLVIGIAAVGYGYDPSASRSEKIKEIAEDLASLGVPLDEDTVRKWLREAAEHLPSETGDGPEG
ncbi:MAG: hypothetical protein RID91_03305 [Azospirillaceae bacterium]